ncbi:hypothetical protein CCP3SC5AM1_2630002 [Gammaproteobacteria bacterium]
MITAGERLKEERIRLGFTQASFGALAGVQKMTQSRYESGNTSPNVDYFECIAKYGVDITYILTGSRIAGIVLPEEVEVLKPDEREILSYYRKSPVSIRSNIKAIIIAFAQQLNNVESIDELSAKFKNSNVKLKNQRKGQTGNVRVNSINSVHSGDVHIDSGNINVYG